jgi:hypothetical protein
MATYKYGQYLAKVDHAAFDTIHKPGTATPFSGVYRCMGCHAEVVSEKAKPLPPQNHHQHTPEQGEIRWRLVVYADHEKK